MATQLTRPGLTCAITALIGASFGAIVGYFVGHDGTSWGYYVRHPIDLGGIWWTLFGALLGAAVDYVRKN